ncbi:TonB-dependent receptor [bacterium]|nr:TonB-dependent receptor [bacterium]
MKQFFQSSRSFVAGFFTLMIRFCLLSLLCISVGQAETSSSLISGVVTDSCGAPISNAHITILDTKYGTVTDNDGNYSIPITKSGNYSLAVSHIAYVKSIKRDILVYQDQNHNVDFILSPVIIVNPEVTVITARQDLSCNFEQKITIQRDHWQNKGAHKISDILREIPGVKIYEGDGSQRISLRGSPTRTVKVDLDGIPLNDAGTGEAELGQINIDQISTIQIDFEGIGGRVHLRTEEFNSDNDIDNTLSTATSIGAYGRSEFNAGYNHNYNNLGGGILLRNESSKNDFKYKLDDGASFKRINNQMNTFSSSGKLNYKIDDWKLSSSIYWEDTQRGIPGLLYSPPTPEANLQSDRISGCIGCKGFIKSVKCQFNCFIFKYTSRYSSPREQYNRLTDDIVYQYPEDNKQVGLRYGLSSNSELPLNHGKLLLDYSYQQDRYKGKDLLRDKVTISAVGLGYAKRSTNSANLKWQYWKQISTVRLYFNPGFDLEHLDDENNYNYTEVLPSINTALEKELDYCILGLNLGWGRSISAPPFNALFLVENAYAVGNSKLKPERGDAFTGGINLTSKYSSNDLYWRFDLTAFHSIIRDLIVWRRNYQNKYYPDNMNRVRSIGFEINNTTALCKGAVSLNSSYTYNRSINDIPGDTNFGNQTPLTARHSGSGSISIKHKHVNLHLAGRWVGRRYSTEANQDPRSTAGRGLAPYAVYDVYLSRSFKLKKILLTCEAGVDNIFDVSYRVIERSPMPGRTYNVKIGMTL